MKQHWIDKEFLYDGSQLRSLYAYLEHKVQGDSIIAWRGPCNVELDHMIDGEDRVAEESICGESMLHFIVEKFHEPLSYGVVLQRLMASIVADVLRNQMSDDLSPEKVRREGDDIFFEERKFSISIATVSPVSTLIHFAVNIHNGGTPVPTCGLVDFGIEPAAFAKMVLDRVVEEVKTIDEATRKVLCVR